MLRKEEEMEVNWSQLKKALKFLLFVAFFVSITLWLAAAAHGASITIDVCDFHDWCFLGLK